MQFNGHLNISNSYLFYYFNSKQNLKIDYNKNYNKILSTNKLQRILQSKILFFSRFRIDNLIF
jgi:hypothetical protein